MSAEEGNARRASDRGRARRREQAEPAPATAQEPAGHRNRGAPLGGIFLAVESAMADATTARWKARDGELGRAALLLRGAQRQLAKAEIRLIELEHQAVLAAARRG